MISSIINIQVNPRFYKCEVTSYYLNNYFLCRVKSFGDKHLTKDEIEQFHLSTRKVTYEEAAAEYEKHRDSGLGRLIANRETPILRRAWEILKGQA